MMMTVMVVVLLLTLLVAFAAAAVVVKARALEQQFADESRIAEALQPRGRTLVLRYARPHGQAAPVNGHRFRWAAAYVTPHRGLRPSRR